MTKDQKRQSLKKNKAARLNKKQQSLSRTNNKSRNSAKSSKKHKSARSKCWMGQQRLDRKYFNFAKLDKKIVKIMYPYKHYKLGSKQAPSKYIYTVFKKDYEWYIHHVGSWTDYDKLFCKNYKRRAHLIMLHQLVRVSVFYYLDLMKNKKFNPNKNKSDGAQTNIRPPKLAFILHDKDKSKDSSRTYVSPHIHLAANFQDKRVNVNKLAKWLGVKPQNIQHKIGSSNSRKYEWENMCAYLIHAKDENKHSYKISDVHASFDYKDFAEKNIGNWKAYGRVKTLKATKDEEYNRYLTLKDRLTDINDTLTMDKLILNYDDFRAWSRFGLTSPSQIASFVAKRTMYVRTHEKKQGKYFMPVIYVTGDSGSGKTYFVQHVIDKLCKDWGIDNDSDNVFVPSSGKNQVDDYKGQPIAFFDEMRSGYFDAQKLLDMIGQAPKRIGARYHNKMFCPRVLFFTSIQSSDEFFGHVKKQAASEQLGQFYRRLTYVVKIYHNHKVGLFEPNYIKDNEYNIHRDVDGFSSDRKTKFYLYPKPKSVEKPDLQNMDLLWDLADESFGKTETDAVNRVSNTIEKCNDYKHWNKFINKMIHGWWPMTNKVTYKDYIYKTDYELATDKALDEYRSNNATGKARDNSKLNYDDILGAIEKRKKQQEKLKYDANNGDLPF